MSQKMKAITLGALFILVPWLGALRAAPPYPDVPVITTVEDFEAAVAPTLQIQSDGAGVYQNSRDLQSIIQSGGDWVLATNARFSSRAAKLDFSQPVAGSGPNGGTPIPLPTGTYKARFISKCHLYGSNLLGLTEGQMTTCPLTIGFEVGNDGYRIQMNPVTGVYVYPDTNFIYATCTGTGTDDQCNRWKLEPSGVAPDGSLRNRANLTKITTSKGKTIEVSQGDFYFSFSIHLAKQ